MITLIEAGMVDPIQAVRALVHNTGARTEYAVGPLLVFIVAAAIVLALAVTLAAGAAIYCISRGGNLEWVTTNGWKVWELKIACRMW